MKKVIWLFSIVVIFSLVNCGGGSSKEAKELLQRILNLVGIPQEIVLNICQDDNNNGICEQIELQAKIDINRDDDDIDKIFSKISKSEDGKYLLETLDPTKPLLLELQDIVNVKYDNGKFTFHFNGLLDNELEKELSIFQTMIDANNLTEANVKKARELDREDDQNKFYAMLLKVLEENLNTLRDRLAQPRVSPESSILSKELNSHIEAEQAMRDNLIEMSHRLLANGIENEFPAKINGCNGDISCVDNNLNLLYQELKITPKRAEEIYPIIDRNSSSDDKNSTDVADNFTIPANSFITVWKTSQDGTSNQNQITIPTNGDGYNYSVDWGDGTHDSNLTTDITHTYSSKGSYTVTIFGKFPQIAFGKNSDGDMATVENDARKLIKIVQWGDNRWRSMEGAFMECTSLEGDASDKPNLSNVTSSRNMFYGATSFNDPIGDWDVSSITDMNSMFAYAYSFNQDLKNWNVSKVTDMSSMFKEAKSFNQDIGSWSVGNVRYMKSMFEGIALSTPNYDSILINWSEQTLKSSVQFNAGDSIYSCEAVDAKDKLLNLWRWIIFDGGTSCDDIDSDRHDTIDSIP